MKFSQFSQALDALNTVRFELPNGSFVPEHFHITEVGLLSRKFLDCGGQKREYTVINLQLWSAEDIHHRLAAGKLKNILQDSGKKLALPDEEVEIEFQGQTIEKYGVEFNGEHFKLIALQTDCLAKDRCGVSKPKVRLSAISTACKPGSNCC
jgi:hypothetical protein